MRRQLTIAAGCLILAMTARVEGGQFNQNCVASIQNRTVQILPDGTFAIPNVPVDQGLYRVRIVCREPDGTTTEGQSALLSLVANGSTLVGKLEKRAADPIPVSLQIEGFNSSFERGVTQITSRGDTLQLLVSAQLPDGSSKDVTTAADGTSYGTSNPAVATVGRDGQVIAVSRGRAVISARNEGVIASLAVDILLPNDADADGMTDEFERANGLNPNEATDATLDADQDGLTNLQEFQRGTNPRVADSDGDGLADGAEIAAGTDPLRADSDGDSLSDGQEAIRRTNPLSPDSDGDGVPDGLEVELGLNPVVADPVTTVQGRVVDEGGAPVAGASAIVFNTFTASTDSTGFFSMPRVPVSLGSIVVLARTIRAGQVADGTSPGRSGVSGGVTDVGTISLGINAGTVNGLVTDPFGRPVGGALVTLSVGDDVRTTVADPTGRYRVANMVTGSLLVTARDPRSGLRGRASGLVTASGAIAVDVRLSPSGTVVGMLFARDGLTPLGAGITVTLAGPTSLTTRTDPAGRYSFDFVPLGSLALEATDAAGNRARTSANITATSQVVVADLTFLARGNVTGLARDGAGNPVPNASVILTSGSVFGGSRTVLTDGAGRYLVTDVFLGAFDVLARSPLTRLAGRASGTLLREGETVNVDITLTASGSFQGTVFRRDGTTPVAGASVTIRDTGLTTATDAQGRYRIDLVPVGSYVLEATDAATGDRGRAGGAIAQQDQLVTVNVSLNGLGRVVVTVHDGADAPVAGAVVSLTSRTVFGGTQSAATQADGTVTFDRVLAGAFDLSALDPATQLRGTASDTVDAGATRNVTVRLQGAGSVVGTVFAPDGVTPVPNLALRLSGQVFRQATTGADGGFRFDAVPLNTYSLEAVDGAGSLRARATVVLATHGAVVRRDLVLIGVGTVRGRVTLPDASAAERVGVTVASQAPGFGRGFFTTTDLNGFYTVSGVPVGPVVVSASAQGPQGQLFGQGSGELQADGQTITIDLRLAANNLYDASNFAYFVRDDGAIKDGTAQFFAGDGGTNRGAFVLDLVSDGTASRFEGTPDVVEQDGRELVLRQTGLFGLSVTRKVFVPQTGYFARYLEVLQNPTALPITVDLRLSTHFRFIRKLQNGFNFDREPRVISTSSGDALLDVGTPTPDRWVVVDDDDDGDPFLVNTLPAVAHAFDGEGALQTAGQARFDLDFTNRFGRLVQEWTSVTVPAGGTVAFLHFGSQQTSRTGAQASAERLVQLPPEALFGLSAEEIGAIRNFAVPPDGTSTLPALPSLSGAVTGRVLAGDGTTPVAGSRVSYRSNNPLFGRTHAVTSDGAGVFRLDSVFNVLGTSVAVPASAFTLNATHPQTGLAAPATTGDFAPGLLLANQDVVFSNSGQVNGRVLRAIGTVASSGSVQISGDVLFQPVTTGISLTGAYGFTGIPAGNYVLVASVPHPQGTGLAASTSTVVTAGQTSTADITLPPTGVVTGFVRRGGGEIVVNLLVQLRGEGGLSRQARTDTGGRFTFSDVLTGTVTVEAFESTTNTAATAQATVQADQTTSVDLVLTVGGSVAGRVTGPSGEPVSGAQVTLSATNGTFNAVTGGDGRYRFDHITPGPVDVRVTQPSTGLRGRAVGSLGLSGQTLVLDVALFASGTVTGIVFRVDGTTPVPGAQVTINRFLSGLPQTVTTDALGRYTFDLVPLGSFVLDALDPATGDRGRASNQITTNGETRAINVTLNGQGRVVVTVRDASGNLVSNAQVTLNSQTIFGGSQFGATGPDGTVTFERVLAGPFSVFASDSVTQLGGSASGTVPVGGTVQVTVSLEPAGTILGRVFRPDGTTPAAGLTVRLNFSRQTTSAPEGSFRLDAVPLGTYTLEALEAGRVRARETGLTLSSNGQVLTRNLVLIGQGAVTGRVLSPTGAPLPNIVVTLRSGNPVIGGFFSAVTDATGRYRFNTVPVGTFTVSAANGPALGETSGRIDEDGQEVTADIQLLNNAVTLPLARYDANNSFFDIQGNGAVLSGTNSVFGGDFNANQSGLLLDVIASGSPSRFGGASIGSTEEAGREIVIRQQNLAGLDLTRKVFVPRQGYFARYLEILSNPGPSPVTVDLRVLTNVRQFNGLPRVVATSSGDTTLDVSSPASPDRWVVVDDGTDGDPFVVSTLPAVGYAFDGAGAAERAGLASFANPASTRGELVYQWSGVTIPAGGTAAYLHFVTQQTSRAAAQASADRLSQLPPEALVGLSADEIGRIRNFAVPADGTSPVPPLPALTGTVTGRMLAGDGTTTVPFGQIRFRSRNIFFGRTQFLSSGADGSFSLASTFNDFGGSRPIPVDGFVLQANHPLTGVAAPDALGAFPTGQTTAVQNIVFTNTGVLRGTVRRHTGAPATSGQVQAQGPSFATVSIGTDGSYVISGLLPGSYTVRAFTFVSSGTGLTGSTSAIVTAAEATTADITLEAFGALTGTVRSADGTPAANVFVDLFRGGFSRSTRTDATGRYLFDEVPTGLFTVRAFEPRSNVPTAQAVTIVQDATTTQDLTLIGLGTVQVQVSFPSGSPAQGANVYILEAARGFFRFVGSTDATGGLTLADVTVGAFTVRVFDPRNGNVFRDVDGALGTAGQTVSVTITLPASATLRVTVQNSSGIPVAGAQVAVRDSASSSFRIFGTTDGQGRVDVAGVVEGPFTVQASDTATGRVGSAAGTVGANQDGQVIPITVTIVEAGFGVVRFSGERDLWVVTGNAGDFLTVALDSVATLGSGGIGDPFVEVYNPDGTLLGLDDDSGPGLNSFLARTLVQSGQHVIVARGFGGNVGGYRVSPTISGASAVPETFPGGTVTGRVLESDGVTPVTNVRVRVLTFNGPRLTANEITNEAGEYTVPGVPFGAFGSFRAEAVDTDGTVPASTTGTVNAQGETVVADITLPAVGTITGRVSFAAGGPTPFTLVQLFLDGGFARSVQTDANGIYSLTRVPVGPAITVRAFHRDDFGVFRDVTDIVLTANQTLTVDITLPAMATAQVTVRRADGSPFSGALVYILDSFRPFLRFAGFTDVDGLLAVPNVPEGNYSVTAFDPNTGLFAGSASGVVTAADDGRTVSVTITAPLSGTVQGTVFAADGATPVPGAFVEVLDRASGQQLAARGTDQAGFYQVEGLTPGSDGFIVRAHSPQDFAVVAERNGRFTQPDETVVLDLTLPLSIVRGRVFFSDGVTPVPFPNVFVTAASGGSFFANVTQETGAYSVFGVPLGDFTVTAQDPDSGLQGTALGTLAEPAVAAVVDLRLQPSGVVTGTVTDADGQPVAFAEVGLTSAGIAFDRLVGADDQGVYRFERVALGPLLVQAVNPEGDGIGVARGVLATENQTLVVDVAFASTAGVQGTVFAEDGTSPVEGALVVVESLDLAGPFGAFEASTNTDGDGHYEFTGVPGGRIRVTALEGGEVTVTGVALATLTPPASATIDVTLGNATRFRYELTGTDGFRYDLNCDGAIINGGSIFGESSSSYDGAYFSMVGGRDSGCQNVGRLEDEGREVSVVSTSFLGLEVERKVFVPSSGGFARYLEVLRNPGLASQTVTVEIHGNLGSDESTRVVVAPSATSNTFAVTDDQDSCCDPALAHVFAGPGAPVGVTGTHFQTGSDEISYRWQLTLAAGETKILMHFAVQREENDAAGARTQAEALAALTDPNALSGLSAAERLQVVNFNVP